MLKVCPGRTIVSFCLPLDLDIELSALFLACVFLDAAMSPIMMMVDEPMKLYATPNYMYFINVVLVMVFLHSNETPTKIGLFVLKFSDWKCFAD